MARFIKVGRTPSAKGNEQRTPIAVRELQDSAFQRARFKENEVVDTGETWIDGRPIFNFTLDVGFLPNIATKTITLPFEFSEILSVQGRASDGRYTIPLPYVGGAANTDCGIFFDRSVMNIRSLANFSTYEGHVWIRFVK